MNATIVLVLILPILVVSLVITVDTVFRTLKQWFPNFESQFFVITFLYFVSLVLHETFVVSQIYCSLLLTKKILYNRLG